LRARALTGQSGLRRFVVAERPAASPPECARMQLACALEPWHAALMPPHQLYGLSALLGAPALRAFLAVSRQQGCAAAQLYSVRTGAEALQDHLFALYLGFSPGLQALHDAAADLVWAGAWFCCGERGAARTAALRACLLRVAAHAAALEPGAPCGDAGTDPLHALGELAAGVRAALAAEVLCDCTVSMFRGGPLRSDDTHDPLHTARAPEAELNDELHARGQHPGAAFARHGGHLRAVLEADVRSNLFVGVRAAWPQIARLRSAAQAAAPDTALLLQLRAFVQASAAHAASGARGLLFAPAAIAERKRYARVAASFLQALAAEAAA